ncbi:sulfite exporter TauE/SafE family protein [Oceanobacillus profundus]|uniref:sulfite exporter TauE/SafE family protein n=1 Tax=Oceanobacillus profundus TaxID=372463 RepID=UPI0023D95736|nr:sulfite exporter TauE/SafE family protein [Oceanobacillus profundus]
MGFISSVIGAMAGLGGGIIIKPVLDFVGHYDLETIGVLSASTVMAMSTVTLLRIKTTKVKIDFKISLLIAVGSIVGGLIGKGVFNFYVVNLKLADIVGAIQSGLLAFLLIIIYASFKWSSHVPNYLIANKAIIFSTGLILGLLSAFLGIGGGPLNVAVLVLLFSMTGRKVVINSTFIIFFSQLASLLVVAFTTRYQGMDLSMLPFMIIGGVAGGLIGNILLFKVSSKAIWGVFNFTILIIVLVNIYNLVKGL